MVVMIVSLMIGMINIVIISDSNGEAVCSEFFKPDELEKAGKLKNLWKNKT